MYCNCRFNRLNCAHKYVPILLAIFPKWDSKDITNFVFFLNNSLYSPLNNNTVIYNTVIHNNSLNITFNIYKVFTIHFH